MSVLTICNEKKSTEPIVISDFDTIQGKLQSINVLFQRWQAECEISSDASQESILDAYQNSIDHLNDLYGFKTVDVIHVTPDHPEKKALRQKFLAEHTHDDFEIRFFVRGCAIFYLHVGSNVYMVQCNQGDLISVPAHTKHWFDMGKNPDFTCIRMFTNDQGWVASLTGDEIADRFPVYEELVGTS